MANSSIHSKSIINISLAIVSLGLAFFIYNNLWPAYDLAKVQADQAQTENLRLTRALEVMETFIKTYERESEASNNLDLFLPHKDSDLPNFLNNISDVAAQTGVALAGLQVDSVQRTETASVNSIHPVDLTFNASGSYASLKNFIQRIESNHRLTDIYHITMLAGSQGSASDLLTYTIKLRTYYQK